MLRCLLIVGEPSYKRSLAAHPNNCCVREQKQHAFCDCKRPFAWCKKTCDTDPNCKGYSGSLGGGKSIEEGGKINNVTCHLATVRSPDTFYYVGQD